MCYDISTVLQPPWVCNHAAPAGAAVTQLPSPTGTTRIRSTQHAAPTSSNVCGASSKKPLTPTLLCSTPASAALAGTPEISLRRAQGAVFNARNRFRVLVAGRRFGKSYLSCIELLRGAIEKPGEVYFYCAPTYRMAKDIAKNIEETMQYPGQIKVTVIREKRSVEFAK